MTIIKTQNNSQGVPQLLKIFKFNFNVKLSDLNEMLFVPMCYNIIL